MRLKWPFKRAIGVDINPRGSTECLMFFILALLFRAGARTYAVTIRRTAAPRRNGAGRGRGKTSAGLTEILLNELPERWAEMRLEREFPGACPSVLPKKR
jgi:hypothetical protein